MPSSPVGGIAPVSRVLQDFPGSKPCYLTVAGSLETPCWIWQGTLTGKGYAQRSVGGRRVTVSRAVLEATLGRELGSGEQAHHRCKDKRCVNPAHLSALTSTAHTLEHHAKPRTALEDALKLLAVYPRLAPSVIARMTGHEQKAVAMALIRAERSGGVRRLARGEYALLAGGEAA